MTYNITEQQRIAGRKAREHKRAINIENTKNLKHKQLCQLEFDLENRIVSPGVITSFPKRISEKTLWLLKIRPFLIS